MPRSADYDDKTDEGPARPDPPGTPVLEPNEAREGITHQGVRVVLAVSLTGAVIALAIVWLAYFR